ncbi:FAD:protein FMN transferase [Rathayibacter rathayi]|uniref:FAD:protein FMN transferase n=1 Tax=Rathayibacter rathayi TaxID=33887 RepID=A0ABX5ABF5_RATRA|nr:FAD:protein FMN transferase [Rathayibacter rathayi]PPG16090.1 FAD:protein FMN transferase [Rathayibacter rathayi]PPG47462.1 FAD:protein FMN transferase [Rathayibacter rathayi]PPH28730.1 FAD:protein FMN transferase [Rathayibacter rathayi]PPH69731.1 FAD:protein FMN transferase [Rathayibacter rathayi]PPH74839.1 FAD:protein FMN transferase [Rathayibacter rathayi]
MPRPDPAPALGHEWRFDAIGTTWQIDTAEPLGASRRARVTACIEDYDGTWSRFRDDSAVSQLRHGGEHVFPAEADELFALYDVLDELTGGAVTPFVGGPLEQLGYDPAYTLVPRGPAAPAPAWAAARYGAAGLRIEPGTVIDIGAAGKGQLVDLVLDEISGVGPALVDASGDLRGTGAGDYRVGLEHPWDASSALGVALPGDRALCGSASNRRAWGSGLHHVLDGRTGAPVESIVATWAVADTALIADGLATALFVCPPETLAERFDFEFVRVRSDGTLHYSPSFPGEVFR